MKRPNWSIVTAAKEAGGRLTRSRLEKILDGGDLAEEIAAFTRRGYHFETTRRGTLEITGSPKRLFAEEIAHDLATEVVGRRVETHWSVASTNDLARREAKRGREGTAIFAEEQTAGRGRFGRRWTAPKYSSLLFSVALHSGSAAVEPCALALAGAVAVAEAVAQSCGVEANIRWPNDVLIEGRKVSGVLIENIGGDDDGPWFVAGVGVNVNLPPGAMPPRLRTTAAGVSDFTGGEVDRALLARAILRRLDFWWEVMKAGESERLMRAWRRFSDILGRFITVESRGKRHRGRVVDLDGRYGLVLQLSGGPTRVFAPAETTIVH